MKAPRATRSAVAIVCGIIALVLALGAVADQSPNASAEGTAPEVTTLPATEITEAGAELRGSVVPNPPKRKITECKFEYGTTTAYGQTATCVAESAADHYYAVVKLGPGETIHYRIVAAEGKKESKEVAVGADESFTTPGAFGVESETAQPETTDAIVRAVVFPFGLSTECEVEYVDETAFKSSGFSGASRVPCTEALLPASFGPKAVTAKLGGLQLDTTYHYRFTATHSSGATATGPEESFMTAGISEFSVQAIDQEDQPVTQAGAHPYKLVTNLEFPTGWDANEKSETPDANPKDISVALPPGLVGNPTAAARCTEAQLTAVECPRASQIGVAQVRLLTATRSAGLFNLVPPSGYPAEFGFRYGVNLSAFVLFSVRTGGDYGITGSSLNVTARGPVKGVTIEVWGVPAEHGSGTSLVPLLTMPTSCSGPQSAGASVDFWQAPGQFVTASSELPALTGCGSLPFGPSISIAPRELLADSPTGLDTEVVMPDSELASASGDAESTLKNTTVTLPAGLSLSPSAANGLEACSQEQFGLHDAEKPSCPDASKIGTVLIKTPLLEDPLEGGVYVAEQDRNPFASVLAIYVAAEADGVLVKLAGDVVSNPETGQLTTTFTETPPLPFSSLKLDLFSGPRAPLVTPEGCGSYWSSASFEAWAGLAPVSVYSPFEITGGCQGGFSPAFSAGSTGSQAGAYAPFVLSFSRQDSEQEPSGLTVNMPPGLLANLSGVPECPQTQAAAGDCPEDSRVGSVQSTAGPGPDPLVLGGSVYLTGPYEGGPFGLAVEVPAIAGPFNLGTVVVRSAIYIDPADAHVTVVSDAFPTILEVTGNDGHSDGFPVHLRGVAVTIDRPDFTLNPTSCAPMSVSATLESVRGATAAVSSPFQASGCGQLPFHPALAASVGGHASKADGAGLEVTITSPGLGQANIRKVELQLPAALPSRDSTLNKACLAAVFEANPAGCDEEAIVGYATVHTPLLASPLTGPAYLVSHGGAEFPDLEYVLQGERITIVLDGKTDIKKIDGNEVTFSKFETAPDAPFTSFETTLPAGPHSILGAYANASEPYELCASKLQMPTTITAQDGATIEQDTTITPTGCSGVLAAKTHKPSSAELLAKALKACKKHKKKTTRLACEKTARHKYATTKTAKRASHKTNKTTSHTTH